MRHSLSRDVFRCRRVSCDVFGFVTECHVTQCLCHMTLCDGHRLSHDVWSFFTESHMTSYDVWWVSTERHMTTHDVCSFFTERRMTTHDGGWVSTKRRMTTHDVCWVSTKRRHRFWFCAAQKLVDQLKVWGWASNLIGSGVKLSQSFSACWYYDPKP